MKKDYNGTIRDLAYLIIQNYILQPEMKNQQICKEDILRVLSIERIWLSDTDIFELLMPMLFGQNKIREAEVKFIKSDSNGLSESVVIVLGDVIERQEEGNEEKNASNN